MVGAAGATFYREQASEFYAPTIVDKIWDEAQSYGFRCFVNATGGSIEDDHIAVNQIIKIPTVDIIDYHPARADGFPQTWHTTADNLQNIDKQTLFAVGTTILGVIYKE